MAAYNFKWALLWAKIFKILNRVAPPANFAPFQAHTPSCLVASKPRHSPAQKHSKARPSTVESPAMAKGKKKVQICGAKKRNGDICRSHAGFQTDHPGHGRCKWHGGNVGEGLVTAAKEEAIKFGTPIPASPQQAISAIINVAAGQLAYATAKVAALPEDDIFDGEAPNRWVRLQRDVSNRLAGYAKVATDMGVAEAQVKIAEQQALAMRRLIEATMEELSLTAKQREALGPILRKNMQTMMIEGTATPKEPANA